MNYNMIYDKYMRDLPYKAFYGEQTYNPYNYTITNYKEPQHLNDIDINKYISDIDINKIYNSNKVIPVKLPNSNGITLIIIKNQLNGEVEYEEKELERCHEKSYSKTPVIPKKSFTTEEAYTIAKNLGIDFNKEKYDVEQFRMGLDVELEHGTRDAKTNVTNDDPILTGKIALAHLNEFPDYYIRLKKLEDEASAYWATIPKKRY